LRAKYLSEQEVISDDGNREIGETGDRNRGHSLGFADDAKPSECPLFPYNPCL
jgi:hypothetical protein